MDTEKLLKRLNRPEGEVDVVIDTDTYNEIDDQFALAYLIKSKKLKLKAIYAAPFFNEKSTGPEDGMEKSYQEILHLLELMEQGKYREVVYKGARSFLTDESKPVYSPAAEDLVHRAMAQPEDKPLYVVAIGAITNVASALLIQPAIMEKIVVVWLGGNAHEWTENGEFNLMQDVAAARVVFGSGVPLVQLPCAGVVFKFRTTGPELSYWLKGKNKLCDYLLENTLEEARKMEKSSCWSRVIWDVTAVGWLLDGSFMWDRLEHSPVPEYDHRYAKNPNGHFIRYVYDINRDLLFEDLFKTLTGQ